MLLNGLDLWEFQEKRFLCNVSINICICEEILKGSYFGATWYTRVVCEICT